MFGGGCRGPVVVLMCCVFAWARQTKSFPLVMSERSERRRTRPKHCLLLINAAPVVQRDFLCFLGSLSVFAARPGGFEIAEHHTEFQGHWGVTGVCKRKRKQRDVSRALHCEDGRSQSGQRYVPPTGGTEVFPFCFFMGG